MLDVDGQRSPLIAHSRPSLSALDSHTLIHSRATGPTRSPALTNLAHHSPRSSCDNRPARPDRVRREHRPIQDLHIVFDHHHVPNGAIRPNVHIALDLRGADMSVRPNVDVVGDAEHEVRHDLLGLAAVGGCDRRETRRGVQCAAGADEDVTPEVDRRLILGRGFLVTARVLSGRFGLRRANQVAMYHDILLNDTFASQNDMAWP